MTCATEETASKQRRSNDDFIKKIEEMGAEFIPDEKYINTNTPIRFVCKNGHKFYRVPNNIISKNMITCPICNLSIGEKMVCDILNKLNIEYKYQYSFHDCKYHYKLPFDFYIESHNTCIEYDGIQHFEPTDFAGKGSEWAKRNLMTIQEKDEIKNNYCKKNNINLIRIPYWELKNIENILRNSLFPV